jgi:hypothetical protein
MVKPLAYLCVAYLENEWHNCGNQSHVQQWRLIKLQPKYTQFVHENMEENGNLGVDGLIDGESLGDLLQIGENFMVAIEEGNDEDVDVYILQCQKPKHVVQ